MSYEHPHARRDSRRKNNGTRLAGWRSSIGLIAALVAATAASCEQSVQQPVTPPAATASENTDVSLGEVPADIEGMRVRHRRSTSSERVWQKLASKLKSARGAAAPQMARTAEAPQIYRFIDGVDTEPKPMSKDEISKELQDSFATLVLRQGQFPLTTDAVVAAIEKADPTLSRSSYLVGEGSQIPASVQDRNQPRNLRYVAVWPDENNFTLGKSILLSAAAAAQSGFHQVISWDDKKKAFNYYERIDDLSTWSWAGDSSYSRKPATIGKGCFDCHHNGTLVMKELKIPWNNWNSSRAAISPLVVPEVVTQQDLFKKMTTAPGLERIVQAASLETARNRVNGSFQGQGSSTKIVNVPELLSHLISNTSVNLESTQIISSEASASQNVTGVPLSYFVNDFALRTVIGIDYEVSNIDFNGAVYARFLRDNGFQLVQRSRPGYSVPGSTHFALLGPVPVDIDGTYLQQLINNDIVTPKFAAAVLLTDFPNPVFSQVRRGLQKYADPIASGSFAGGKSDVPQQFAELVRKGAAGQPPCDASRLQDCTAEGQFLFFWDLPDSAWQAEAKKRLNQYLGAVAAKAKTDDGVREYMRLFVSRQQEIVGASPPFRRWPLINNLAEFSLLFPTTSGLLPEPLEMTTSGSVRGKKP